MKMEEYRKLSEIMENTRRIVAGYVERATKPVRDAIAATTFGPQSTPEEREEQRRAQERREQTQAACDAREAKTAILDQAIMQVRGSSGRSADPWAEVGRIKTKVNKLLFDEMKPKGKLKSQKSIFARLRMYPL